MATSLSKSIKECIENQDKQSMDRLFDRVHSAVEEFVRQDTIPLPYCYQGKKEAVNVNGFPELKQVRK